MSQSQSNLEQVQTQAQAVVKAFKTWEADVDTTAPSQELIDELHTLAELVETEPAETAE